MNLEDLFNEHMLGINKEKSNDGMASVSSGTSDSSGSSSADHRPLDLFATSNDAPSKLPSPPVGNKVSGISLDWGYGPTSKNTEEDEEGEKFETYSDNRTFRADVISFIERTWFDTGDLPEYRELHKVFKDYPEAPRFIKGWKEIVDGIKEQLDVRGLPSYRTSDSYLDPRFVTACNVILNIQDGRSDAAKLKELGLTSAQWNAWLRAKKYQKYYQERADKIFDEEIQVEAKRAVSRLVKAGDLSAVKYLNEWNGTYRQADNTTILMQTFMSAILAILARNVASDVINTISAELREDPGIKNLLGNMNAIESKAS